MVITRTLNNTGKTSKPGKYFRKMKNTHLRRLTCSEVFRSTWCTQKSIMSATSILSSTAISSISFWSAIQAAICVFDCSMASGQVIPTKKATSTEMIIISFTPWKVCFSTKLKQTNIIITKTNVSISIQPYSFFFCESESPTSRMLR